MFNLMNLMKILQVISAVLAAFTANNVVQTASYGSAGFSTPQNLISIIGPGVASVISFLGAHWASIQSGTKSELMQAVIEYFKSKTKDTRQRLLLAVVNFLVDAFDGDEETQESVRGLRIKILELRDATTESKV